MVVVVVKVVEKTEASDQFSSPTVSAQIFPRADNPIRGIFSGGLKLSTARKKRRGG